MVRSKYKGTIATSIWERMSIEQRRHARQVGYVPPIAGGALEQNVYGIWAALQTLGRGTPASMTVATKRPRLISGDINPVRTDGSEPFSDGTLFGNAVDFVNTLEGTGAPVVQGQSGIIAYLTYLAAGQETVTGGVNDVQTLHGTATGGTFTLTMNGYTTAPLNSNATAAQVQAAILAATNSQGQTLPAASVTCTGGPLPTTDIVVTFTGPLGNQPVPPMTINVASLTGGTVTVTHTTSGTGYQHVATPNDLGGFYSTWAKSVGKSVVTRVLFNDCRITQLRWEGSSASKVVHVTPSIVSYDPGQQIAADPTKQDDGTVPFIYTEAAGTFTIDGAVFRGHSAFAMEAQWGLTPWYGDDVVPFDVLQGRANLLLQGITILLDAQGLARWNQQLYNTPTPAAGAKPIHNIPALGSYSCLFNKVSPYTGLVSESAKFEAPSVKWDPNLTIPMNPAGGPVELPMAGEFRKIAGQPAWRVTTVTPNDAAYSS